MKEQQDTRYFVRQVYNLKTLKTYYYIYIWIVHSICLHMKLLEVAFTYIFNTQNEKKTVQHQTINDSNKSCLSMMHKLLEQ